MLLVLYPGSVPYLLSYSCFCFCSTLQRLFSHYLPTTRLAKGREVEQVLKRRAGGVEKLFCSVVFRLLLLVFFLSTFFCIFLPAQPLVLPSSSSCSSSYRSFGWSLGRLSLSPNCIIMVLSLFNHQRHHHRLLFSLVLCCHHCFPPSTHKHLSLFQMDLLQSGGKRNLYLFVYSLFSIENSKPPFKPHFIHIERGWVLQK